MAASAEVSGLAGDCISGLNASAPMNNQPLAALWHFFNALEQRPLLGARALKYRFLLYANRWHPWSLPSPVQLTASHMKLATSPSLKTEVLFPER